MSRVIKAEINSEINLCKMIPCIDDELGCNDEKIFSSFLQILGMGQETGVLESPPGTGVSVEPASGRLVDIEAGRVLENAGPTLEAIKKEAEVILDEARKKAADLETNAYNQGYAQGQKDGEEFGRRQYETKCARLKDVMQSIQMQGAAILQRYESQLVRLCMDISRCIIHREIEISPETIILSLKEALKQAIEGSRMDIRLNPRDAEIAQDFVKGEIRTPGGHTVNIIPDSQIGQGGCLIETDFGLIDATIDGKWQAVTEAIKKVLDERSRSQTD